MESIENKNFDTINSILSVSANTNALLNSCLDVLIAIHLDGKDEEYKDKFLKKLNSKLQDYDKSAPRLFIELKD
jgi:flagellar motor switch protein FliG